MAKPMGLTAGAASAKANAIGPKSVIPNLTSSTFGFIASTFGFKASTFGFKASTNYLLTRHISL